MKPSVLLLLLAGTGLLLFFFQETKSTLPCDAGMPAAQQQTAKEYTEMATLVKNEPSAAVSSLFNYNPGLIAQ